MTVFQKPKFPENHHHIDLGEEQVNVAEKSENSTYFTAEEKSQRIQIPSSSNLLPDLTSFIMSEDMSPLPADLSFLLISPTNVSLQISSGRPKSKFKQPKPDEIIKKLTMPSCSSKTQFPSKAPEELPEIKVPEYKDTDDYQVLDEVVGEALTGNDNDENVNDHQLLMKFQKLRRLKSSKFSIGQTQSA